MIDLTPMGGVRVDPERRRAWVQAGPLGALDRASALADTDLPLCRPTELAYC
jgi:hypothetical protein